MSAEHFCRAMAQRDMRFVVDILELGGSWR
jgi:hypothetical protein